jgi:hypothetical protein
LSYVGKTAGQLYQTQKNPVKEHTLLERAMLSLSGVRAGVNGEIRRGHRRHTRKGDPIIFGLNAVSGVYRQWRAAQDAQGGDD